jgi:hypothetical protein
MNKLNADNIVAVLERFRCQFPIHGQFVLSPDESINSIVIRESVSIDHGVYIISGCREVERSIIYIGKAGTILQNGKIKKQGLRKRLTMKQGGLYRRQFFWDVMSEQNLDCLRVEWFGTYSNGGGTPPFLAEAELLAAYLAEHGRLPALN